MRKYLALTLGTALLLSPLSASASPAYDTSARVPFSSGTSQTLSYTCASGAVLFAASEVGVSSDVLTGITYNSVTMNFVGKIESAGGVWSYMYFVSGVCDGSAHNIVASISGGAQQIVISAISYTGASTVTPTGGNTAAQAFAAASTWAQSLTPSVTGGLAVAYVRDDDGRTITAGANTTVRQDGGGSGDHLIDSGTVTVTNGTPFTLNISGFSGGVSPTTASIMAIINPPAAASSIPPQLLGRAYMF